MKLRRKLAITAAVLVTTGLATWAYARLRTDPAVAKVQKLGAELASAKPGSEQWKEFRTALDKLPPDQRKQATAGMREGFRERQSQEMKRFFALSAKARNAYLDKQILDSEKRRKEWAAKSKAAPKAADGANSGTAKSAANGNSNGGNTKAANTNGGGGGPGGRPPMTAEQRDQRRKQRLDDSSPEERAQRAEFRRVMTVRRQQLGLPSGGGGRWGG